MGVGRRVKGEGPVPCRFMIIGEWPDRDESRSGRVFVGKPGQEVDRYLDGVRLPNRYDCYLTNFIKEWCGEDGDYTQADFDRDEPELIAEIRRVQPRVIVALGRHVARWLLGDVSIEETHAIQWYLPVDSPRRLYFDDPAGPVVHVGYNPAAGFRSPEISSAIAYDFAQLEAFLDGRVQARVLYDDPHPEPEYTEITDIETLDAVLSRGGRISTDTEGWPWAPWSVQLSHEPGRAYVLRYSAREPGDSPVRNPGGAPGRLLRPVTPVPRLIERFAEWVNGAPWLFHFVFHSALHDLAVFRAFGIDTRLITFDDTQIMAYNLQLEPLGLKPLATRFCGMQMQDFEEVMGDASYRLAVDWLLSSLECEDADHEEKRRAEFLRLTTTPYTDAKGRVKPGRKIRCLPPLPKTDLHKTIERCLRSATPRALWGRQVLDRHVEAEARYGNMWEATLDHVPLARAIRYAGRDADATGRVEPHLLARLRAADLETTYRADVGTVPLIDRMQQVGIRPDLGHFQLLGVELGHEILAVHARLTQRLVDAGAARGTRTASGTSDDAGAADRDWQTDARQFNPNSTYHVGELLFKQFDIRSLKNTPGGDPSTNDKILEALQKDAAVPVAARELITDIREYREFYKLKHTFVDKIPSYVNRWPYDGRIHATFRITRVVTGRLAASDPNLLAMPKYGKFAGRFREGFVSGDGRLLGSWDLSQIELRVLAHLSQDPVLLRAYRDGLDLHAILAQRLFGRRVEDYATKQYGEQRRNAKIVNFMIPMGATAIGLCLELRKNGADVSEDDAQRWLDETMALYAKVPEYQQHKIAEARRDGFVADLRGRRRYVGGIHSRDRATRAEAERFACATPIQAGAQEIMKLAEAHVWNEIVLPRQRDGQWIEPLIQIHDDLILEFDERIARDLNREMVYAMTQTFKGLSVPIETSGDAGENWGHMHAIEEAKAA